MISYVLRLTDPAATHVEHSGNKGANVAFLTQKRLPVPTGFIVTARAYQDFIANGQHLLESVNHWDFQQFEQVRRKSEALRAALFTLPLHKNLITQVYEMLSEYPTDQAFAVRSSLLPNPAMSSLGQGETYLNHIGEEAVFERIRDCFLSLWKERAIIERKRHEIPQLEASTAVVIQQMIVPELSGVAYTHNIVNPNSNEYLLSIKCGITIEQWLMHRDNGQLRYADLTDSTPHPQHSRLTDAQIEQLYHLIQRIKVLYDTPQSIDWCLAKNYLYLLQTRPLELSE
ncbi:PEP/pyruvate-binding domain-containing protein [Thioflexithrix psekupsensis]|uniref:Pyruvate phosphate dikinase AMP/ATP-binding domain-containing protein n=1 Tax=Thioflexithrix psekupsensis TaxID=1570016 RepID=A0A251XC36_9GAMM|nr:PEP/pyruvate-binding domain-containing protein [Thioflexithrix psekupsensis]OUD15475.1 hypothetical protein TPSD3_02815 [Thioflexithrix psekupsensis]